MIALINNYIQYRLQQENLKEVSLTIAAKWLSEANILHDLKSSPGYPLRRYAYRNNIFGAYQKNERYWFIRKIAGYKNLV